MPSKLKHLLLIALLLLAGGGSGRGETATNQVFLLRAEKAFVLAEQEYRTNPAAAWQFGRACFHVAERATNHTQRADYARRGIAACREAVARETNSAPAHFYLAANLGELAQAEAPSLAAYRRVHDVEREFKIAAELDVAFDHAAPARTLGELYIQAPGWPLSVGSSRKAREWFERAVELAPDYPGNQIDLAEAQLKWREREALEKSLKNVEALWPAARTNYTGETWEAAWQDWEVRRAALKTNYHRIYGAKP
jgi:hypothetical protein